MNIKCPFCKSEKTEQVVIKFMNGQEQKVGLCMDCKKIFKKEEEKC